MTFFQNARFMAQIVKRQGADECFGKKEVVSVLIYTEMETRLIIETAIKFMRKQRRTKLQTDDIEMAAQYIGHGELAIAPHPKSRISDNGCIHISQLIDSCGFNLTNRIEQESLKGRWIYKNGEVCPCPSTSLIKKLQRQQINTCQSNLVQGHYNLLLFRERQMLSKEEIKYLKRFQKILIKNKSEYVQQFDGNVLKMFPMYLALIRNYPNEAGIAMLIQLIHDPSASRQFLSHYLNRILEILLVYRGKQAYGVGQMIADLVKQYSNDQPDLIRIMERPGKDYSFLIKAIAFEEKLQFNSFSCQLEVLLKKVMKQSFEGNEMAMLVLSTLTRRQVGMQKFVRQGVNIPFWIPSPFLQGDSYLGV